MKAIFSILLISLWIGLCQSHSQFDKYLDPWNSLATIEGQFETNHTLFKYAKCDPCDYMVIVYRDYVELLIDDPQEGKTEQNILAFEFNIQQDHYDETVWDYDRHSFKLFQKKNVTEVLERITNQGVQWSYELTLPIEGLILKGRTPFNYETLIPLITLLMSILIFATFPLTIKGRKEQEIQIPRRTPLVSLIILGQLQHIILIEIVIMSVKYLIHEESFMMKSLWYIVFMIPFGILILQILYIYDGLRVRFQRIFKKIQSARLRDIALLMLFFIGIYLISLVLLFTRKGIWIYGYFGVYLLWQFGESIIIKTYPYLKLSGYFLVLLGYQMFLSNYGPLFWFEQLTLNQIVIFWISILSLLIFGSILQKFLIGIEIVNQVLFQESKNIQMRGPDSAQSTTQVNLQT